MQDIELILGNSSKRFSGVTSTMLQVLKHQKDLIPLAVLGKHHLPDNIPSLTFWQFIAISRRPLANGKNRLFHARRNDEMIQALIAKKLFGAKIKIVFTSTAQRQHTKFTKWLMRQMDGIITTCNAAGSYLDKPADAIISHGVDPDFTPPPISKAKSWSDLGFSGKIGIGMFGRVRPSKGIDLLVDAAIPILKKHPEATVIACGETTPKHQKYLEEQQRKITDAGLEDRFLFIGKQPFSELPKLFQGMSIVTALSRNEGFGLTVLEAMASGAAVLTSPAGAWLDLVKDGINGYTVPFENIDAIQKKLDHLLQNPDQVEKMGEAGRKLIEQHYTTQREAAQLCQYYRSLM